MKPPKMSQEVKEWAEKQKEPAFAKTCWLLTTDWFKDNFTEFFYGVLDSGLEARMSKKLLTIEGIEKSFDEKFNRELLVEMTDKEIEEYVGMGGSKSPEMCSVVNEEIKSFYRSKISEMLESLRMEERNLREQRIGGVRNWAEKEELTAGYNLAVSEFNEKLDTLRGKV